MFAITRELYKTTSRSGIDLLNNNHNLHHRYAFTLINSYSRQEDDFLALYVQVTVKGQLFRD